MQVENLLTFPIVESGKIADTGFEPVSLGYEPNKENLSSNPQLR